MSEQMNDNQIKHMVDRFLGWKLPDDFNPDGGISFTKTTNEDRPSWPQKNEPTGTNLFDADQAEEMVRYMLAEPSPEPEAAPVFDGGCLQHKGSPCDCREILDRMPDFLNDSSELVSVTPPASEAQAPAVTDEERYQREMSRLCGDDFNVQAGFQRAWLLRDAEIASLREKLATAEARVAILDAQEVELPPTVEAEWPVDEESVQSSYLEQRERQLLDALRAVHAWREVAKMYQDEDEHEINIFSHHCACRACSAYDALAGKEGK